MEIKTKTKVKLAVTLFILSGVFYYLYYNDGWYSINNKYSNDSIRDLAVMETENPLDRIIDFNNLKAINKDVAAWAYIPGTTVDYPVLIGSEDETYLKKDIDGKYNPLGSVFSYADTKLDDGHIMLFGHNMKRYQMFGELKKFLETDYMKNNRKMYLYTEDKTMELDIVSIFITDENDDFFTVGRKLETSEYVEFISDMLNRNKYSDFKLGESSLSYSDSQTVSLVTCHGREGTSNRLVVNGVVSKEKHYIK